MSSQERFPIMVPLARLLVVLVATMALQEVDADFLEGLFEARVTIINKLPGGMTLTVHCKSRDDDLGFHTLRPNQSWVFKFTQLMFRTLFFCSMQWPGHFHYVDIYDGMRDIGSQRWLIKPEGACRAYSNYYARQPACREWKSWWLAVSKKKKNLYDCYIAP